MKHNYLEKLNKIANVIGTRPTVGLPNQCDRAFGLLPYPCSNDDDFIFVWIQRQAVQVIANDELTGNMELGPF